MKQFWKRAAVAIVKFSVFCTCVETTKSVILATILQITCDTIVSFQDVVFFSLHGNRILQMGKNNKSEMGGIVK